MAAAGNPPHTSPLSDFSLHRSEIEKNWKREKGFMSTKLYRIYKMKPELKFTDKNYFVKSLDFTNLYLY
jgi:hypothetical protein